MRKHVCGTAHLGDAEWVANLLYDDVYNEEQDAKD